MDHPCRLLSHNTYLIPAFGITYETRIAGKPMGATCIKQRQRAAKIVDLCRGFDIVKLQEIWGGASYILQRQIQTTHTITPRYLCYDGGILAFLFAWFGFLGWFLDIFNYYWLRPFGGLFSAHKSSVELVWSQHSPFPEKGEGESHIRKGVSIHLYDMKNIWCEGKAHKYLMVLQTHLYAPEPRSISKVRQAQLRHVVDQLIECQTTQSFPGDFYWENCAVVFVGDMNTSVRKDEEGDELTDEYKMFTETGLGGCAGFVGHDMFNIVCGIENKLQTYVYEKNSYVSHLCKEDSSRMDYAFYFDKIPCSRTQFFNTMPLKVHECEVVIPPREDETSDHYALALSFSPQSE